MAMSRLKTPERSRGRSLICHQPPAITSKRISVESPASDRFTQLAHAGILSLVFLGLWGASCRLGHAAVVRTERPPIPVQRELRHAHDSTPHGDVATTAAAREEERSQLGARKAARGALPSEQQAPSVVWLIVMPAIPILGGAFIYITRCLFGADEIESRHLSSTTPSLPPTPLEPAISGEDRPENDPFQESPKG